MNGRAIDEWVAKAEDNYLSALTLSRHRKQPVPDVVCNQCQQCVEKYLKALLVRHGIYFPKIHDLIQLEELAVPVNEEIRSLHELLLVLNPYGIDIRYPGLKASLEESIEAVKAMKKLRHHLRLLLGL